MNRPIILYENMRAVPYVPFYLAAERGDRPDRGRAAGRPRRRILGRADAGDAASRLTAGGHIAAKIARSHKAA